MTEPAFTKSSPGDFGSGELKIYREATLIYGVKQLKWKQFQFISLCEKCKLI